MHYKFVGMFGSSKDTYFTCGDQLEEKTVFFLSF